MSKKIIVNEKQYQKLLDLIKEELGISDEVKRITHEIEKKFNDEVGEMTENKHGIFFVDDLKVEWKLLLFDNIENFSTWYSINSEEYKNGYSTSENTMYLTVIAIGDEYNISDTLDTIQHEVEHYYQTKMKKGSLSTEKYQLAVQYFQSNNQYLSNFSKLIYFSKRFEIDAYVNDAYNSVRYKRVNSYEDFIEKTELNNVLKTLTTIKKFFNNAPFNTPNFLTMEKFIKENEFIIFNDEKELREKLNDIIEKSYDYFLRKTAKVWVKIRKENEERNDSLFENGNLIKLNHIFGEV